MKKIPNPQGKGLVPVLESLAESQALVAVTPKHIEQISSELFTSLFILHSHFQFKPVVGKSYWLYQRNRKFQLSLISPQEWGSTDFGMFVGECILQKDVTWTLTLDTKAMNDPLLMSLIENRRREFELALTAVESLDQALPFYLAGLPFYQRVYASALANSLQASMVKSGIVKLNCAQARKALPSSL